MREMADKSLDWKTIGPVVTHYRQLIGAEVARDTRKLYSTDAFQQTTSEELLFGTLRHFFEQRRAFLLRQ